MIRSDQPDYLREGLLVAFSSKSDGSMLDRSRGIHEPDILEHRRALCAQAGVSYENVVYQEIVYGAEQSYEKLIAVTSNDTTVSTPGVQADGLVTDQKGVGLFLPVADCVATVVYDPKKQLLALLHLGRHSTLTTLVTKTIEYFKERGSNSQDLLVWMSPSAKLDTYVLEWFDQVADPAWSGFYETRQDGIYVDLAGYNRQRCIDMGVPEGNIVISPIDTTTNPEYFSHRAGDTTDRIAVLAMMR